MKIDLSNIYLMHRINQKMKHSFIRARINKDPFHKLKKSAERMSDFIEKERKLMITIEEQTKKVYDSGYLAKIGMSEFEYSCLLHRALRPMEER